MKYSILIILALIAFGHSKAQTFSGNQEDIQAILKNTKDFSKYIMSSNYEKIATSYTEDAKIFPNNMQILEGEDIIKYWTLPEGVSTSYHNITQSEIAITGGTAYDYGYYEGKTKNAKGEEITWGGKYVIVWKKINGDWKMYLDIWNNL